MANYILKLKNECIDYSKDDNDNYPISVDLKSSSDGTSIKIGSDSGKKVTLSLHKMSFHRKVYEPGRIDATIQISKSSDTDFPTIQEFRKMFMRKNVELYEGTSKIASGYYVHEVRPHYDKDSSDSMYVNLKIYSIDNLMRINKFSEAYLGRKLREYIATKGINDYGFDVDTFDGTKTPYSIKLSESDDLQNLSYDGKEFIQPYLVQYNETFYDFLARVCNRCGEFMYFEDGRLHIGLHHDESTTTNGTTTKYKKLHSLNAESCKSIDYQNISVGVVSVTDYAHDSLKQENSDPDKAKDEEFDPDERREKNTIKIKNQTLQKITKEIYIDYHDGVNISEIKETGAYPDTKTEDGRTEKIYCDEVSNNEFFMPLYRDEFSGGKVEQFINHNVSGGISSFLEAIVEPNGWDRATHFLSNIGQLELSTIKKGDAAREDGNKIIDTWTSETDAKMGVPFADTDRHRWTTLRYYSDIKCNEEGQEQQMVSVDMGNAFADLRLGDVVTLPYDDENRYVVVEVEIDSSSMCFSAVPLKKEDVKSSCWKEITDKNKNKKFEYTDNGTLKFFPPLQKIGAFRQSEPQHAIVIDSNDPKNQGRVRVRFPWQAKVENTYSDNIISSINDTVKVIKEVYDDVGKVSKPTDESSADDKNKRKEQIEEIQNAKKLDKEINRITKNKDEDKYKDGKTELENEKTNIEAIKEKLDNLTSKTTEADKNNGLDEILDDIKKERDRLLAELKKDMLLEAGTPWIRMVTPMATKGGGMYFKPEKGDEVMVDFENGNIERPFVVGALYSKNAVAPMEPANKLMPAEHRIIKSPNGHYIKFEDATNVTNLAGSVLPIFKFMKQWNLMPEALDIENEGTVKKLLRNLMGGITISDGLNLCQVDISGHDRKVTIKSTIGDVEISSLTGMTIKSNGNIKIEGKNIDISAGNRLTLTSGTNLHKSPLATVKDNGVNVAAAIIQKRLDEWCGGLIDMTVVRSLMEIIIKPANGTLQIKSHMFLKLEAGEGDAEIPVTAYKEKYLANTTIRKGHNSNGYQMLQYILYCINTSITEERFEKIAKLYNSAYDALHELYIDKKTIFNDGHKHVENLNTDEFINKCCDKWNRWTLRGSLKWSDKPIIYKHLFENMTERYDDRTILYVDPTPDELRYEAEKARKDTVAEANKMYKEKVVTAYLAVNAFYKYCMDTAKLFQDRGGLEKGFDWIYNMDKHVWSLKKLFDDLNDTFLESGNSDTVKGSPIYWLWRVGKSNESLKFEDFVKIADGNKAHDCKFQNADIKNLKRRICLNLFGKNSGTERINGEALLKSIFVSFDVDKIRAIETSVTLNKDISDNDLKNKWGDYVKAIKLESIDRNGKLGQFMGQFQKKIDEKMLSISPEHEVWSSGTEGKILMSDSNETMEFHHVTNPGSAVSNVSIRAYGTASLDHKFDFDAATRNLKKILMEFGGN